LPRPPRHQEEADGAISHILRKLIRGEDGIGAGESTHGHHRFTCLENDRRGHHRAWHSHQETLGPSLLQIAEELGVGLVARAKTKAWGRTCWTTHSWTKAGRQARQATSP